MGDIRINLRTIVTVGGLAFVGVWLLNRGLAYAGMQSWQA